MMQMTGRVIEDGFWFVLLTAVLSYFWFHHGKHQHNIGNFTN